MSGLQNGGREIHPLLKGLGDDDIFRVIADNKAELESGKRYYEDSIDPDIIELFPAHEMYLQTSGEHEPDWQSVWNIERGKLGSATTATKATGKDGPFIALKHDPIWAAISRFGLPYPPFDYYSKMWLRDADVDETERLGVLPNG